MIDPKNPAQAAWLQAVNTDIGNLVTTNLALTIQNNALAAEVEVKSAELRQAQKTCEDMGQTNRALKDRVKELEEARKVKRG